MRMILPAALLAVFALSGCASRQPSAGLPGSGMSPPQSAPIAVGKSNRFQMTQNGRQMSADDFDEWMKARGIRVAKGPQVAKRSPSPVSGLQAQAKPLPKAQAKAQTKPSPPKRR
ncbi:MAG: hypothetical protein V4673_10900 [Pseudomonadota bacterium]